MTSTELEAHAGYFREAWKSCGQSSGTPARTSEPPALTHSIRVVLRLLVDGRALEGPRRRGGPPRASLGERK